MRLMLLLLSIFLTGNAYSVCLTHAQAKKLQCERYQKGDSWCASHYGREYVAFLTDTNCSIEKADRLTGGGARAALLEVNSLSDEVESMISNYDREKTTRIDQFFTISGVKLTFNFESYQVKEMLTKLKALKEKLYVLTQADIELNSMTGKSIVLQANNYLGYLSRIYRLYADTSHKTGLFSQANFDNLKNYNPHFDKKVALELLARLNLKAKHIDGQTIEIQISEAEKQSFEYYAIQNPKTISGYGKLVQFMSIRDLLTNRWAMQRMTTKQLDNPVVNSCGQGMLSFRPGKDKKMGSSAAIEELFDFDLFYNNYARLLPEFVEASKKHHLTYAWSANNIVESVFKAIPTIEYVLLEDFGWEEEEIEEWKKEVADSIIKNERVEWNHYAETMIYTAMFPGDNIRDKNFVVNRMLEDIYKIRSLAVLNQIKGVLSLLPPEDMKVLEKTVNSRLVQFKPRWEKDTKPLIEAVINKFGSISEIRKENRRDKFNETLEIVKAALPAAYLSKYIADNRIKKLNTHDLLPTKAFDPKSPMELLGFFQNRLISHWSDSAKIISYSMKNTKYSNLINRYFEAVSNEYMKRVKNIPVNQTEKIQSVLHEVAYNKAKEFAEKYPYKYERPIMNHQPVVADNTRVYRPPILIPVYEDGSFFAPNNPVEPDDVMLDASFFDHKPDLNVQNKSDTLAYSNQVMNLLQMSPAVADKTRVEVQRYIPMIEQKKKQDAKKTSKPVRWVVYNPYEKDLAAQNEGELYFHLFNLMNLGGVNYGYTYEKSSLRSFLISLEDQKFFADQSLSNAYVSAPMLKIPLVRSSYYTEWVGGVDGMAITKEVKSEKPALIRMVDAYTLKNGKAVIQENKLREMVNETFDVAEGNVSGQVKTFCGANYNNHKKDDNFKTMFRSSTFVRQTILGDDGLDFEQKERFEKFDEQMRKDTRYWHEAISEDYIEPMMMVAMVIFIIAAFVIPLIGSAGLISPGMMLLLITILDGVDLVITGASLYFRGVTNFYEVPAQIRFQESLAKTQITDLKLTTWEDVDANKAQNRLNKIFTIAFAPIDAIVGGQFYFSSRKLLGITGKNSLRKMGVPARGFGRPPEAMLIKNDWAKLRQERGIVRAIGRVSLDALENAKKWLPRYQPYTQQELTNVVRVGLVNKAIKTGLAKKPWAMADDLKQMIKRIDDRLEAVTRLNKETGEMIEAYTMTGKFTFKEFIANPTYAKEYLIPKSFIQAVKEGKVGHYLMNYSDSLKSIGEVRGKFMQEKMTKLKVIQDKLDEVKKLAVRDPSKITKAHQNEMDYFLSLLSDSELKLFKDFTKFSKGEARELRVVFKDHDRIMETIRPMTSVNGVQFGARWFYPHAIGDDLAEEFNPVFKDAREDLISFYESMLKHEAYGDLNQDIIIMNRRIIEDQLY
jgi:hypothetical protein